ncbi:MAG: FGGY family carbohydrate kinase, partial [Rikenellaceae bacterium]
MKSLGIDIGSSSIKVSLMDISSGECAGSVSLPDSEMTIDALKSGWAEQFPLMWWDYVCSAITLLGQHFDLKEVASIGITYQMHGLVCVGSDGVPLRKAIIWCDSRATEIGAEALEQLGRESCLSRTLNSPGNFTASKFAWVMRNEPDIFAKTTSFMLPGDFIAYKLSGKINTTLSGLSEQILWNFKEDKRADFVAENYGIPLALIPNELPSIGIQAYTDQSTATLLGIKKGTPISYRAGDQPNNAFSLNVMENGEVAATGGTSGVVYGVTNLPKADPLSRVNTFLHVNHSSEAPRYGVLLCINGTGILNAWVRRNIASDMSYDEINNLCEMVEVGCDGVSMLPFG